uniref:Aminotransferase-like plant mobile domain-containing protein n=1 Tax=Oryza meridionalis TaxID=40149 RepID=A0A0E0FBZ3_9ORYZ
MTDVFQPSKWSVGLHYADLPNVGGRRTLGTKPQLANVQDRSAYEYFIEAFDLLKEDNIQWCPYTDEETQRHAPTGLSTLYLPDSSYWLTKKMLVYDIAVEAHSSQRVMRQFGLYEEVPVPLSETVPPKIHLQKRKGDASVRQNIFAKMTSWVEEWLRATHDIVNGSRPYDRCTYVLYMRWYTAQTRVRLVTIADPDIPEMTDVDTLYPMQSAPVTHLTGDIAEELYAETTSLWEKLRDNIAGSREDMMSALDRLRQKCKRIMRAASCRHASDMYRLTGHWFADPLPKRPSTSSRPSTSRPSTSARPSAFMRPRPAARPVEPSTIIQPDNEGGKAYTNNNRRIIVASRVHIDTGTTVVPSIPHASSTGQWQRGFAPFAGSSQMVPPMHTEARSSQFQGGFSGSPINTHANVYLKLTCTCFQWVQTISGKELTYNIGSYIMGIYQMYVNENTQPQGPSFLDMLGNGDWLFSQPPIMQPQTTAHNPTQNHVATVGGRPQHITD